MEKRHVHDCGTFYTDFSNAELQIILNILNILQFFLIAISFITRLIIFYFPRMLFLFLGKFYY